MFLYMLTIFLHNDFLLSAKDLKSVHGEKYCMNNICSQGQRVGSKNNFALLLSKLKLTSVTCLEDVTFFLRDSLSPCLIKKLILIPAL